MKKMLLWLLIICGSGAFLALGTFLVVKSIQSSNDTADVVVISPIKNSVISSPVAIAGRARGSWFFEGSFPVVLKDAYGTVLAESHVTAQGEWMTQDYVSFVGTLQYQKQIPDAKGVLIFIKDNPSGLPENDESVEVPIIFK